MGLIPGDGVRLRGFCDYVDKNSDPGVPLTFLSADVDDGVPRFEEAPYHILPGERFAYEFDSQEGVKPYFGLVLKHDDENGVELTKEVLLHEVLSPHLESHGRKVFFMDVYDEDNEYFLRMLGLEGLWAKIESPERNVFYCYGNSWYHADLDMITGSDSCATSLAY